MASEVYTNANAAFVDEDYEKAVQLYNEAIETEDGNSEYYSSRAQAYIKLQRYPEAVKDAEKATQLNTDSSKAFLRLGISQYHMKEYIAAQTSLATAKTLDATSTAANTWLEKCHQALQETRSSQQTPPAVDDTPSQSSSSGASQQTPPAVDDTTSQSSSPGASQQTPPAVDDTPSQSSSPGATAEADIPHPVPMPAKPKTRYDWYQTEKFVVVTILIKKVQKEDLSHDIQENSMSVSVKLPSGSDYSLELDLAHPIIPDQSIVKILSTKIEVKLKKRDGLHWAMLEGEDDHIKQIPVGLSKTDDAVHKYPSSSHYTRDWDKVVSDIKAEEKDDKPEGDAALNNLFQQIYGDGNEEVRKAMNKSFVESGGTVLSTNWGEVGGKKVDMKPPDGMEFKKW